MIRAAIITTSRADWNALGMVADAMRKDGGFEVAIIATDQTARDAAEAERWRLLWTGDTRPLSRSQRASNDLDVVSGLLEGTDTKVAVILGDRWDALAAAMGASMAGVPIAHLSGGDTTTGSLDDRYRWAITHLATWHFPTWHGALARLIDAGIPGSHIWNFGSPAIDRIKATPILPTGQVFMELGIANCERFCVLNWQPETAARDPNAGLRAILDALKSYSGGIVAVGQNDDVGATEAAELIRAWAKPRINVSIIQNLRPQLYLSALANADFLIGNSSSGIYEAPTLDCAVINVGNRQKGRPISANIANAGDLHEILNAIAWVTTRSMAKSEPLFGDGNAAPRIVETLKSVLSA